VIRINCDNRTFEARTSNKEGVLYTDLPIPCYAGISLEYPGTEVEVRPLSFRGGSGAVQSEKAPMSWFYELLTADDSARAIVKAGTGRSELPQDFVRDIHTSYDPAFGGDFRTSGELNKNLTVKSVSGRAGWYLDYVCFTTTSKVNAVGSSSGGSVRPTLTLQPGEYVTEVTVKSHGSYLGKGVTILTSKGRSHNIHGSKFNDSGSIVRYKARPGYQIIGVKRGGNVNGIIEEPLGAQDGSVQSVALGKPCKQSSTLELKVGLPAFVGPNPIIQPYGADTAVDGVLDPGFRFCEAKTKLEKNPWWEVDLLEPMEIKRASALINNKIPLKYMMLEGSNKPGGAEKRFKPTVDKSKWIEWKTKGARFRYWRVILDSSSWLMGSSNKYSLEMRQFCAFAVEAKESKKKSDKQKIEAPALAYNKILAMFNVGAFGYVIDKMNRWIDQGGDAKLGCPMASKFISKLSELTSNMHMNAISPSMIELEMACRILSQFNNTVKLLLPMADLTLPEGFSELSDNVRATRRFIFFKMKSMQWKRELSKTQSSRLNPTVIFSMLAARQLYLERKTDHKGRRSLFGQFYRATKNMDHQKLFKIPADTRCFQVRDINMSVADAGGPYRDYVTKMMKEIHDPVLPLFVKCPNGRLSMGENRNCYVPRSSSKTPVCLEMYELLGKFMGMVMRSQNLVALDFPGLVWKKLIRESINEYDVKSIDVNAFNKFMAISKVERSNPNPQLFDRQMQEVKFVAINSEGKQVELVPNGDKKSVTWKNRREYVRLLKRLCFHEFDTQIDAMHKGLAYVVPMSLLAIFTWQEVAALVCGRGMSLADIELLKQMTSYSGGHNASTPTIKLFWKMMTEKFNEEDRAQFLVFVWGRSRLPTSKEGFKQRFTISGHSRSNSAPNKWFPIAHTCGFSVEMPKYTTLEAMESKIRWAMYNCTTTDADGSIQRSGTVVGLEEKGSGGPSLWG